MKKVIVNLLLLGVLISGCQKNNTTNPIPSSNPTVDAVAKPYSNFTINNSVNRGSAIMELWTLDIKNNSQFGDTYLWDFGNGNYSTDKTPTDVVFAPCMRTITITLTVTNKAGEKSVSSQSFYVQCSKIGQPHTEVIGAY